MFDFTLVQDTTSNPATYRETNLITEGVENTLSHIASQIDSSKLDF